MITHIVLFKFKSTTTAADIATCFQKLDDLKQTMPDILTYTQSQYQSNEGLNQGFDHGFIMTFASEKERDAYLVHPDHVKVAQFIQQYLDFPQGVIAFDGHFKPVSAPKPLIYSYSSRKIVDQDQQSTHVSSTMSKL